MKVLILGGTGVISRAIVEELLNDNHDVAIFNRGSKTLNFKKTVDQIIGDRKNISDFEEKMQAKHFDVIIDMIAFNKQDAMNTIRSFKGKVKQFIFTSSVAAYKRSPLHIPMIENTAELVTEPIFPYGYNKAEMERYLQQEMENDVPITIVRPSLTYGIGSQNIGVLRQNENIINRIRNNKPLVMFGDGTTPWNFTFAADLARGYAGLVDNKKALGEAFHITSDEAHIWDDLYLEFGKILGIKPKIIHIPTELLVKANPALFMNLYYDKMHAGILDNTKIKSVVPNFKTQISLHDGLTSIINWYEKKEMTNLSEKDIFEDKLVAIYNGWVKQMEALNN